MKDEQLEKRIYDLTQQVASGFAATGVKLDTMASSIKKLEAHIDGNGKDGMRIELDRLIKKDEQRSKREWWAAGFFVSLFIAVVGIIGKWILG